MLNRSAWRSSWPRINSEVFGSHQQRLRVLEANHSGVRGLIITPNGELPSQVMDDLLGRFIE